MTVLNVPFSYVDRCYLLLGGMVLNRIRTSSRGNESVEVDGREKVAEKATNMSGVKCEDFGLRNNRKTVKTYKHSKMEWMRVCVGLCVWIHADDNNTHCSHYELNRLVTCVCVCVWICVWMCSGSHLYNPYFLHLIAIETSEQQKKPNCVFTHSI